MNRSNLYIPDSQNFIKYLTEKTKSQIGKGFNKPKTDSVPIELVSPAEQTVNQAKSELKREDINTSEILSLLHKLSKPTSKRKSSKKTKSKTTEIKKRKKQGNKETRTQKIGKNKSRQTSVEKVKTYKKTGNKRKEKQIQKIGKNKREKSVKKGQNIKEEISDLSKKFFGK